MGGDTVTAISAPGNGFLMSIFSPRNGSLSSGPRTEPLTVMRGPTGAVAGVSPGRAGRTVTMSGCGGTVGVSGEDGWFRITAAVIPAAPKATRTSPMIAYRLHAMPQIG